MAYMSIKPWINIPFQVKPYTGRTGSGTKLFSEPVSHLCYPVAQPELITDVKGAEVTTTTRLYVDYDVPIKVTDNVIFEDEERPILRISSYYREGHVDIKVVYL